MHRTSSAARGSARTALLAAAISLGIVPLAAAQAHGPEVMVAPDELQWAPGPGSLPPGAEFVLIEGNPSEPGPLTLRLKFPAGYRIPAHTHPAIEHITVLAGVFNVGMGDALDETQGRAMPVGSFVVMPVGHTHFAWTDEETIVQLHSMGPWGIDYVDPANDPRIN
jgi:quercetin dioxygenase-like cupin family protein